MDVQILITNFLTSAFVVTIATYFVQKKIDKRLNKIEEFQRTLLAIRKEKYNTLLKALQEIWKKIIETEYYLRHGLAKQVMAAHKANDRKEWRLDTSPLNETLIFLKNKSILLDKELSNNTLAFYANYLEKKYNGYVTILQKFGNTKTLDDVNAFIPNALGESYKRELADLKMGFEKQLRNILYNDKRTEVVKTLSI